MTPVKTQTVPNEIKCGAVNITCTTLQKLPKTVIKQHEQSRETITFKTSVSENKRTLQRMKLTCWMKEGTNGMAYKIRGT